MHKIPSKRQRRNFMREMRRKRARSPQRVLSVKPGDVVVFAASRVLTGPDRNVRVREIKERYGSCNGGRTPMSPLVIGENVETGKQESFDALLLGDVIERAPCVVTTPVNYFRQLRDEGKLTSVVTKKRGEWVGTLHGLAMWVLAGLPFGISREVDDVELADLWERDRKPGFRGYSASSRFIIRVNAKVFARWLRRNATKVCKTVVALHMERTRDYADYEQIVEEDMRAMFDEDDDRECAPAGHDQDDSWDPW